MNIGFIGLGIMGTPMAKNLISAGHQLHIHSRTPEKSGPLIQLGATSHPDCRSVSASADIVIIMVSDTDDVESVLFADTGLIHGAAPGHLFIDMSTISPVATRAFAQRLASQNIDMLDAPVSGGEQGAINASLSIMVGGKKTQYERTLPLFQKLGTNIVHIGDHGAGQVAKACNQLLAAQTIAAVSEALLLAKASGVDPALVRQALLGGFAGSKVLEIHGQRMLQGNYQPGFKAKLHNKDMRIVMELAAEKNLELPGAAMSAQYMKKLVELNKGELDSSAIATVLEDLNHIKLDN